ncbi:BspA family leucine-rich repeat surface protein, partial [Lactococcus petauri]|uniref:BspA family leucine-rich repeat surface protein n=1 Tax=Lactococcus petauri TaxID=1940789 RepID=UPI00254D485C
MNSLSSVSLVHAQEDHYNVDNMLSLPTSVLGNSLSKLISTTDGPTSENIDVTSSTTDGPTSENIDVTSSTTDNSTSENIDVTSSGKETRKLTVFGEATATYDVSTKAVVVTGGNMTSTSWGSEIDKTEVTSVSFQQGVNFNGQVSGMFAQMPKLEKVTGLEYLSTEKITDMSEMFRGTPLLNDVNFSGVNTSNVTNMRSMFESANIKNLNLSNFDTSNVTDMSGMFAGTNIDNLNLSNFDTSNVTDMSKMFLSSNIEDLDLSGVDTSNVTDMTGMFAYASIKNLNLSNFDTSNVIDMSGMFMYINNIESLDVSSFDTSSVTDMTTMFIGTKLKRLTIGDNFQFIGETANLDIPYFQDGTPSNYWIREDEKSSGYTPADFMNQYGSGELIAGTYVAGYRLFGEADGFYDEKEQSLIIVGGSVTDCKDWAGIDSSKIKSITFKNKVPVETISLNSMFKGLTSLASLDLSGLDTSKVIDMASMFANMPSLTSLNLSGLDTSKVIDMASMFANMPSLTSLNLSGFDTHNVKTMTYMFSNASSLTSLDLADFNTTNLVDMAYMFAGLKLHHLILGEYFRFKGELSKLGVPYSSTGIPSDKWCRADGKSSGYSPADFIKNYGTGDLTAGEYVAEKRIFGEASYTYNELEGKLVITGGAISNA